MGVILYVIATLLNTTGLIFRKEKAERLSYAIVAVGLLVHGAALLYRWSVVGHGPYQTKYEVCSSIAWTSMFLFVILARPLPKFRPMSIFVFPASFMLVAIGLFFNPASRKLPPTLNSIWLVLHVSFYKIALATILIGLAFSVVMLLRRKSSREWLERFPDNNDLDIYAYRFAGFGFTFWGIAMLSGGIWAYESWGRFWAWDPIETWSLITWAVFGIYLHLRRFFGWRYERAAYLYIFCFALSVFSLFFVPLLDSSIHSEYFQ